MPNICLLMDPARQKHIENLAGREKEPGPGQPFPHPLRLRLQANAVPKRQSVSVRVGDVCVGEGSNGVGEDFEAGERRGSS